MDGPSPGVVRLFLSGDVMMGRGLDQALAHPLDPELREAYVHSARDYLRLAEQADGPIRRPIAPAELWGAAADAWRRLSPHLRLMNLETAVTRSDDFADKGINYRMNPANLPALAASGVDAVGLANNHVLDFGVSGLNETLETLHAHRIATAGAGRDLAEAARPATLTAAGRRVLFYSVANADSGPPPDWAATPGRPGVRLIELTAPAAQALARQIAAERRAGDLAVVSIHWGSNWGYEVPESHRRFAHALIDSGQVALVHGHSSHHPRPIEVYRGRLILHGCGDFLNDYEGIRGYEAFRSELVAMYFADLDAGAGTLARLVLVPLKIRRFRLAHAGPGDVAWLAAKLSEVSAPLGVRLTVSPEGWIEATWKR